MQQHETSVAALQTHCDTSSSAQNHFHCQLQLTSSRDNWTNKNEDTQDFVAEASKESANTRGKKGAQTRGQVQKEASITWNNRSEECPLMKNL